MRCRSGGVTHCHRGGSRERRLVLTAGAAGGTALASGAVVVETSSVASVLGTRGIAAGGRELEIALPGLASEPVPKSAPVRVTRPVPESATGWLPAPPPLPQCRQGSRQCCRHRCQVSAGVGVGDCAEVGAGCGAAAGAGVGVMDAVDVLAGLVADGVVGVGADIARPVLADVVVDGPAES